MRYLIFTENKICHQLAANFIPELERFDVRSKIELIDKSVKSFSGPFKNFKPDLLIAFGGAASYKTIRFAKKKKVRTCFFYQSLLDTHPLKKIEDSTENKIYWDLPRLKTTPSKGSLLIDFLRKADRVDLNKSATVCIASVNDNKWLGGFQEKLSNMNPNLNFRKALVSLDLSKAVSELKMANAVIATDQFTNMLATLSNSPTINVYRDIFFSKAENRNSVANKILKKRVVETYSSKSIDQISKQLERILNDYNYSAGLMDDYQQLKSTIGTQPFSRTVAQEIVNWIEN